MFMPKTTIHKNNCSILREYDIRLSRQFLIIFSITKTLRKKKFPDYLFWFVICTPNARHISASNFFRMIISHKQNHPKTKWFPSNLNPSPSYNSNGIVAVRTSPFRLRYPEKASLSMDVIPSAFIWAITKSS